MIHHDDFEVEPIPGLPTRLPEGEYILWQGSPEITGILKHVLHFNWVVGYFALLFAWQVVSGLYDGMDAGSLVAALGGLAVLAGAVFGLAWLYARAVVRTTIYTITNRRVVMRFGVALPVTFNFPFSKITSADLRHLGSGRGTIAISLVEHTKVAWLILWPHVRPWRLSKPEPALRAIADADAVGRILAEQLHAAHGQQLTRSPKPAAKHREEAQAETATPAVAGL